MHPPAPAEKDRNPAPCRGKGPYAAGSRRCIGGDAALATKAPGREKPFAYPADQTTQVNRRLEDLYRRHLSPHEQEERDRFGICLATTDGEVFRAGDHDHPFALQSISKAFVYGLALEDRGRDHVLERVGVEPSGEAFNSIEFDDRNNRPYNPMVNAGALVTTDLVGGEDPRERLERILGVLRRYAGNEDLVVDDTVFASEMEASDRNRAISYLMRSAGMIGGDVEEILALYLRQCSVRATCRDLAVMAATLANGGVNPLTGERALASPYTKDVLSVLHTCGMYDFAGEWAYKVGIPAKSGVSGGILAVVPGKLGIGVFSPRLDAYGNSARHRGVRGDLRAPRAARLRRRRRRRPAGLREAPRRGVRRRPERQYRTHQGSYSAGKRFAKILPIPH